MALTPGFWEAGRGIAMPPSQPIRSVAIGRSVITVGVPGGTLITAGTRLSADAETADPLELAAALAEEEPRETIGELTERSVMTASEATDRVEQAAELLRDALAGELVDLARAGQVLDVLQRLDKDGRYEEWLHYARSVHGVLVLLKRWMELLRLLRTLLRSGAEVHEAGRAWVQHELGTLQLAAGDSKEAARLLEQARSTRQRLQDGDGLAATEQSLGVLCRQQAQTGFLERNRGRLAVVAALALLLLVAGGVAGAVFNPFGSDPEPLTVAVQGAGVVTAAAAAISCPDRCDAELDHGSQVTLTASARRGSTFEGWSGDCGGAQRCRLSMDGPRTATARFVPHGRGAGGHRAQGRRRRRPRDEPVRDRLRRRLPHQRRARDPGAAGRHRRRGLDLRGLDRRRLRAGLAVPVHRAGRGHGHRAVHRGAHPGRRVPAHGETERRRHRDQRAARHRLRRRLRRFVRRGQRGRAVPGGGRGLGLRRLGRGRLLGHGRLPRADDEGAGGEGRLRSRAARPVHPDHVDDRRRRAQPALHLGLRLRRRHATVPLTATPAGENNSVAWTGCTPAVPGATSCEVTMSENRQVSARFFFAEP